MFRQGQLAVHGLAILLGRNKAAISNRGKKILHHAVHALSFPTYLVADSEGLLFIIYRARLKDGQNLLLHSLSTGRVA